MDFCCVFIRLESSLSISKLAIFMSTSSKSSFNFFAFCSNSKSNSSFVQSLDGNKTCSSRHLFRNIFFFLSANTFFEWQ